jgi:cell division inhibitor SulA
MPASKPPRVWSSADLDAAIERVMPEVLALLADGVPRTEAAIVAALADRHSKQDVMLTLMRLDVLGQLVGQGRWYLVATPSSEPAERRTTRSGSRRS